ncbi:MAG: hypothetical protein Q7V58_09805 [Actinomycetota bacterium]|jgi:hypothetical protein|nr:hypothetical protein [Actinomycetota bacterium]
MSTASSADRVLRAGVAVTVVGLAFTLVAILPLVFPGISLPGAMWFLSMLTGVGLVIVFVGLALGSRTRRTR